uniref:Uncharacterized protein n=1 Tax=Timema douglasi TaxID=61478 RepID=A0A7R8Z4V2_TIMDO|nr:unnamed protein product [Timema douglasi]
MPKEHTASSSPSPLRHDRIDVTTVPSTSQLPAFQDKSTLATPSTSGKEQARTPLPTIPSPFKRVLFWPEDKETPSSKKKREKVPSVVSSSQWQEYNSKKFEEKKKKEQEKEERKKKREEKQSQKLEKDKQKKLKKYKATQNSYSESDSPDEEVEFVETSDSSLEEIEDCAIKLQEVVPHKLKQGVFVLIEFIGEVRILLMTAILSLESILFQVEELWEHLLVYLAQ